MGLFAGDSLHQRCANLSSILRAVLLGMDVSSRMHGSQEASNLTALELLPSIFSTLRALMMQQEAIGTHGQEEQEHGQASETIVASAEVLPSPPPVTSGISPHERKRRLRPGARTLQDSDSSDEQPAFQGRKAEQLKQVLASVEPTHAPQGVEQVVMTEEGLTQALDDVVDASWPLPAVLPLTGALVDLPLSGQQRHRVREKLSVLVQHKRLDVADSAGR